MAKKKNVIWDKEHNMWIVKINFNGRCMTFGTFKRNDYEKAVQYAKEMEEKYSGWFVGKHKLL